MRGNKFRAAVLLAVLSLAACGGSSVATADPERGRLLYTGETKLANTDVPTCIGCHAINAGEPASIGPNLSNIGNRAATTVPGQAAEEYLRTAIIEPDAFLAGGYQEGIHYRGYKQALSEQQVSDLVAYMLTLRSGQD